MTEICWLIGCAVLGLISYLLLAIREAVLRTAQAAERTAKAAELTALYTRELCWRAHDLPKPRNGKGELLIWQDPAKNYDISSDILADALERMEAQRRWETIHGGPAPRSMEGTDYGPEAEAIKAETAVRDAEFKATMDRMIKPAQQQDGGEQ